MQVRVALTVVLGCLAFGAVEARAQQKQPPDKKEALELLKEKLEGAEIRLEMAKVKLRIAEEDKKATQAILQATTRRLELYRNPPGIGPKNPISREELINLELTVAKYSQEVIQKQGAVELSQLEVRYRAWQRQRVESAIKRLQADKEK